MIRLVRGEPSGIEPLGDISQPRAVRWTNHSAKLCGWTEKRGRSMPGGANGKNARAALVGRRDRRGRCKYRCWRRVQAWTLATAFLAAILVIHRMTSGICCVRVGRVAGGGRRLLRVIRTGRGCLIVGKRNLSTHRRRRARHRVGELTEDESAQEEENHGPMRESTMTHGSRLAFHPRMRNRSPLKGAPRHAAT
jgi:hypothetical protein